ncbi:putative nitrate/sulfonate/bicarbonate ABC transporter permease protein [Gottschalkia acidurici 9a]|uniref:Nitrate/sulfonate/bicarbonate ABC transporter permease protein n=1 Tax=Gottschalkia acidurici (strain ATCC 7906 / DSM 604 / BCRC 14475 / CIP 104303 / KCTC 5404 / NCIMB 10678 / 9a) TaxID=1128398 RepID=K0B2K3_GOTA9|nr:ABC transporter permease subunit [Gottschalkia acidurici]AFS79170.1 putative nitrate/sulfonate/bicarbonate ABC transporter permease protein [Gottschalkia acidurici 9a]
MKAVTYLKEETTTGEIKERKTHKIKAILPLIGILINNIVYYFLPSYRSDLNTTNVYPILLWIIGLIYIGILFISRNNKKSKENVIDKAPILLAVTLLLIGLDILTLKTGFLPLPYFPWPDRILNAIINDREVLAVSVLHSLRLLAVGYISGAIVGLITGVLMGWYKWAYYWINPFMKAIGPIPAVTWIPLIMLLFPTGIYGSAFLIFLAVWFPVTLMTSSGISNVRNAYFEVAKTLGGNEKFLILKVAIPAALPNIFLGLFQGMTVSCVTLMVAEMLGVEAGLGWYISWATGWAEYDKVYASILIILITFSSIITLLFKIRSRALSWQKGVIKW